MPLFLLVSGLINPLYLSHIQTISWFKDLALDPLPKDMSLAVDQITNMTDC